MSSAVDRTITDMEGGAALPRKNGELIFEAPWEARAFGMVVRLCESGLYQWDDFKERLIRAISQHACKDPGVDPEVGYYHHWLCAFEQLLKDHGILSNAEIEARAAEYLSNKRDLYE
ncbi:MAG: nitrile hydratase accessory protein [Alicyclobacillaceae bacterium]|nr:nitrile hydratase accessory protein [Alicyclobacillaceae bacterium]